MSLNLPYLNAHALLRDHGLRADKGLGQNFLHDPIELEKIINAAQITSEDQILEIGPGLGSLTRYLATFGKNVICVELEHDFIAVLYKVLEPYKNVQIIEGDILNFQPSTLMSTSDYLVVANVPYYITSAIFRHLLQTSPRPKRIVLTIQKEVAQRICAKPGNMSLLALSVQVFGKPVITNNIPADAFYPIPKVDSAIIRVDISPEPLIPADNLNTFFRVAKAGFSQKRKTLRNSISAGLQLSTDETYQLLEKCGVDPMRRAETLSIHDWAKITCEYVEKITRLKP